VKGATDAEVSAFLQRELPVFKDTALDAARELVRGDHSGWGAMHALAFNAFVIALTEALLAAEDDNPERRLPELRALADQILRVIRDSGTVVYTRKGETPPNLTQGGSA
jgi:hypothetical protein